MSRNKRLYWLSKIHTFCDKHCVWPAFSCLASTTMREVFSFIRVGFFHRSIWIRPRIPASSSGSICKLQRALKAKEISAEMEHASWWWHIKPHHNGEGFYAGALIWVFTRFCGTLIATQICWCSTFHPKNLFSSRKWLMALRSKCNFFSAEPLTFAFVSYSSAREFRRYWILLPKL